MATGSTAQSAMASLALCQAMYWAEGVPAETRLFGIGRILGFDRETTEANANIPAATEAQPATERRARTPRAAGTGTKAGTNGQRAPRNGTRRDQVLAVIRDGNGLSRGEILELIGVKGDKSGEMSVSNALTALTKRNTIRREDGKYLPAIETVQQGTLQEPEPLRATG